MSKQHTRRRRARCAVARALAVGAAVATLATVLGAGQALASAAQPDERVLERQGWIDRQADEQEKAQAPTEQGPGPTTRRFPRPEPKMDPGPWIDEPTAPAQAPPRDRPSLAVPVTVAVLLVLALGAAAAVWLRSRRPRPEPTSRAEPTT